MAAEYLPLIEQSSLPAAITGSRAFSYLWLEQFHPDLPGEAEAMCAWNKARRRDMASSGKELQRRATGTASGIDGTVRVKLL